MDLDAGYGDNNTQAIGHIPPPGEEADTMDQEGGDISVLEGLADDLAQAMGLPRMESHIWTDCVEVQKAHWEEQMDNLVQAYLTYWSQDHGNCLPHPALSKGTPEDQNALPFPSFTIQTLDSYCGYLLFSGLSNSNNFLQHSLTLILNPSKMKSGQTRPWFGMATWAVLHWSWP